MPPGSQQSPEAKLPTNIELATVFPFYSNNRADSDPGNLLPVSVMLGPLPFGADSYQEAKGLLLAMGFP